MGAVPGFTLSIIRQVAEPFKNTMNYKGFDSLFAKKLKKCSKNHQNLQKWLILDKIDRVTPMISNVLSTFFIVSAAKSVFLSMFDKNEDHYVYL